MTNTVWSSCCHFSSWVGWSYFHVLPGRPKWSKLVESDQPADSYDVWITVINNRHPSWCNKQRPRKNCGRNDVSNLQLSYLNHHIWYNICIVVYLFLVYIMPAICSIIQSYALARALVQVSAQVRSISSSISINKSLFGI